jgi:putative tryptophan/tyrosine transport system substrate-binding protein
MNWRNGLARFQDFPAKFNIVRPPQIGPTDIELSRVCLAFAGEHSSVRVARDRSPRFRGEIFRSKPRARYFFATSIGSSFAISITRISRTTAAARWCSTISARHGFLRGLSEAGCVEGRNVTIEYRWADGENDRVPALAVDLVRRRVAVIIANYPPVLAAKTATTTIPIVFTSAADPVKAGLVASFNRPGGNITGVYLIGPELETKRLEFLQQLVPGAISIGVLVNPKYPDADRQLHELKEAAGERQLHIVRASTEAEIDEAIATVAQQGVHALLVASDPFFSGRREQLVVLAARYRLPAIYNQREYAESGGLASYGTDFADGYRQAGNYVGRILKGEKPADLPVVQPTKIELVINLKTAKTLGLKVPESLLATADEVIEGANLLRCTWFGIGPNRKSLDVRLRSELRTKPDVRQTPS